jgi:LDH2 family malate/lactate/ureidoglycolate dehydrogenase
MSAAAPHASPSVNLSAARLAGIAASILRAAGADEESAALVAGSLVESDLRGVASHGAIRIPEYLRAIADGRIDPRARPQVRVDAGPVLALDGRRSFGALAAGELARGAAARARVHGVCLATLAGVSHVGRVGAWVEQVALEGLVALAWCNCGEPGGNVVPFGGRSPRLGTNPMAYAIPRDGGSPLLADFSTSIAAEGKVRVHLHEGRQVPAGWLLDAAGAETCDPRDLYAGGAILPMGGHKGFALGLLVEILGGVLAGGACASLGESAGNGLVLLALDPEAFGPRERFASRVERVLDSIVATPAAAGSSGVVLPGAPEAASVERLRRDGIPLSGETWDTLIDAAEAVGLDLRSETTTEGGSGVI